MSVKCALLRRARTRWRAIEIAVHYYDYYIDSAERNSRRHPSFGEGTAGTVAERVTATDNPTPIGVSWP